MNRVHIVRGALSNPELIVLNFNDVLNAKEQDVQLEPGDIVYAPQNTAVQEGAYAGSDRTDHPSDSDRHHPAAKRERK